MELVYHKLVSVDEAVEKVWSLLRENGWPRSESIPVFNSLGHVLAVPFYAIVDSPPFDRSVMDGYAVRASDVSSADESHPLNLHLIGRADVGRVFSGEVGVNECVKIATGAPLPRGSDAVVMVEFTKEMDDQVTIYKGVSPGENLAQAGSDVSVGDLVLRANKLITSRELAALSAQGLERITVYRKPSVGIFSTGDEIIQSGESLETGKIYDVNGPAVSALLREMQIDVKFYGILPDEEEKVTGKLREAMQSHDVIITSGSTSAGFGDMIYRVFDHLGEPGVVVHGIKIRPGKPTVIALGNGKVLVGLPGFPLSAIMVFHMVVKPLILKMSGLETSQGSNNVTALIPFTFEAGKGKRDLVAVQLVLSQKGVVAYPLLAQSGSASALAVADGFIDVSEEREFLREGEVVQVATLAPTFRLADLTIIGSHCLGVDRIIERMPSYEVKAVNVGSWSGWQAIKRGEADIAGTHLLDEETLEYNVPFLKKSGLEQVALIIRGYSRKIGLVIAQGNPKKIEKIDDLARSDVQFVNRNKGSGIRTYFDFRVEQIFGTGFSPSSINGYTYEVKTHTAVAAAVSQGRADCGLAFEAVTAFYPVDFIPLGEEKYDFLVNKERFGKNSVQSFFRILSSEEFRKSLVNLPGYFDVPETGKVVAGQPI